MVLFGLEYFVVSRGMTFTLDVLGEDEQEVINDLTSQVGVIKVISLYRKSGVDRITDKIRKQIIENYLMKDTSIKKVGRPRKY